MEYLKKLEEQTIDCDTAVSVGKFDGIHKGHELLAQMIIAQKKQGLKSVVFTFDTSPRLMLEKELTKNLITNEERAWILQQQGIDYLIEYPFSEEVMHMEPEEFIRLLVDKVRMRYMAVGSDFRFGYKGRGDVVLLKRLAVDMGFELEVISKIQSDHRDIRDRKSVV